MGCVLQICMVLSVLVKCWGNLILCWEIFSLVVDLTYTCMHYVKGDCALVFINYAIVGHPLIEQYMMYLKSPNRCVAWCLWMMIILVYHPLQCCFKIIINSLSLWEWWWIMPQQFCYNNCYFAISMVILGVANWRMRITQSDHAVV